MLRIDSYQSLINIQHINELNMWKKDKKTTFVKS